MALFQSIGSAYQSIAKNGGLGIGPQPGNVILHGILALERESGMERFNYEVCTGRDESGYYAYVPDFETCFGQGETYEEMIESIRNGLVSFVEGQVAFGLDIPNATFGHRPELEGESVMVFSFCLDSVPAEG